MLQTDVTILMPTMQPENYGRFTLRYGGLADELAKQNLVGVFTEGHGSYNLDTHAFVGVFDIRHRKAGELATTAVVRDLTMPTDYGRPLYTDLDGPKLVHRPATNQFLADKSNLAWKISALHPFTRFTTAGEIADTLDEIPGDRVVIKPTIGRLSENVHVLDKKEAASTVFEAGEYLVQEFIDTSDGIRKLGVRGVHNIRMISIGSTVIGAIARVGSSDPNILKDDVYGKFISADRIPEGMLDIASAVHRVTYALPGRGENIIAIDTMRGVNAVGDLVDVLCEVNRRPIRISRHDALNKNNRDALGLKKLGKLWDRHEAALLARQVV